jgi:gliding motility-associated-like protein
VPTAFSPNGDGVNDKFGAVYNCAEIKSVALRVFNRWGEKVFETSDQNEKWDGYYKGLSQPLETYVYYLNVEAVENSKPKTFSLMGNVTLIR